MYEIYLITNQINGKVYVGKTGSGTESRWKEHVRESQRSRTDRHLYNAMRHYGVEYFSYVTLHSVVTEEEADVLEKKAISDYESRNSDKGYNMTEGGDGARVLREESLQKIKDYASERFSKPENIPWYRSDVKDADLIDRYRRGDTILKLSEDLSISSSSINSRLMKAGILRRGKRLPVDSQEMALLYKSGLTAEEIGGKLSVSKTCVLRRLRKLGVSMRCSGARIKHGRYSSKRQADTGSPVTASTQLTPSGELILCPVS